MFIGHFAVGFGSKRFAPRTSLVWLLAAPLLADILWPVFIALGWEHVRIDAKATRFTPLDFYDLPWSHSLVALLAWGIAFAFVYWGATRNCAGAVVLCMGVVSHWLLDWITHRPDMPLYPGGPRYGLGLWNSIAGTMVLEFAMFAVGVWIYARITKPKDRVGRYGLIAYVVLLAAIYGSNPFSGPPDSVHDLIWSAAIGVPLILAWAWWFDCHRVLGDEPGTRAENCGRI